jgi:Tol biopolymer transport system component
LRPAPEKRAVRFFVAPPAKAIIDTFKLSPDGRYVAIAADVQGKRSLWVRPLESLEPQALPGTDEARYPFWSPDSRYIGFFAQGKLKKTAVTGGPPQTLCEASDGRGGAWNRDGVIVFSPSPAGGLFRVAAAGGAPVPVTTPDPTAGGIHRFPEFLPDGRHFLYLVTLAKQQNGLYLSSLDSKDSRLLLAEPSSAAYAPGPGGRDGYLLFARESTLTAQPFDPSRGQFAGEPFPVAEQVGFANLNHAQFSVSPDGSLVYLTGGGVSNLQLTWFDREGKQLGTAGQPGPILNFALSPDEKRVAVERLETPTAGDIWMVELARGAESRFTFDPSTDRTPIWSPDGSRMVFSSTRAGRMDLYQKVSSGAGKDELLLQTGTYKQPTDWSRDGRFIVYREAAPKTKGDLWLLPLAGDRKPIPYLQTEFTEDDGRFSPDGRWMAYSSDEAGRMEVYVQPIPPSGAKWQISTTGGAQPRWRRDGKELFYLAPDRKLMVAGIQAGATIQASAPKPLFETRTLPPSIVNPQLYEPTADGRRFLITTLAGESAATPLTVVVNWTPPRP